jgi:hypothetical protein
MSTSSDETARFTLISRVLLASVGLPMFIVGIIGNFINMWAFAYRPQFNKLPSSIFLLSSFIASQIDLIAGLLLQLVYRISGIDPVVNYLILCKLRWYIGPLSGTIALYYICCAAINQYLVTSRKIRLHQLITRRRAVFISFFAIIFWTGVSSPALVFYTHVVNSINVTTCMVMDPTFAAYLAYFSIVVYSLIPMIVLSIFSLLTWYNVRSNLIRRRPLEQSLTRLLLAQIVMVLLTSTANLVNQMYFFYTRTVSKDSLRLAQESVASSVLTLFGFSTHSISFYTYLFTSKAFRQNIRPIFVHRRNQVEPVILRNNITGQRRVQMSSQLRT